MSNAAQDAWNNNNLAHTDTWGYLFLYEEINVSFHNARDVPMVDLAFYSPAVSSGFLKRDAETLALRLDRAFRKKSKATFESGWTVPKSKVALASVLVDPKKLVCELATTVDEIYNFTGETVA